MLKHINKLVLKNSLYLFSTQIGFYFVPLILLPYLIRTIGIENFGLLAFATATISLFRGIVEYGFNLSGTKQISVNRNNKEITSKLVSSILISKIFLIFISFFILLLLLFFNKFNKDWEIYFFTFLIIFADILFMEWFFQGIEDMKTITYIKLFHKIVFVILVLLFVENIEDYYLVPLIDSLIAIFMGFFTIYIITKKYNINFHFPEIQDIIYQLKDGWHIFLSRIAVILYTSLNIFVLGLFVDNRILGFYSFAEKIYLAIRGLLSPLIQALYPFLSAKYLSNQSDYYTIVKKLTYFLFFILSILSLIVFIFSPELIKLISKKEITESIIILKILSISLLFSIGTFYSSLLVIKNKNNLLSKITLYSMLVNVIPLVPIVYFYNIYGLAILFLFVQFFHMMLQLYYNREIFRSSYV